MNKPEDARQPYQLGEPDWQCRYPVLINGQHAGLIFRWHRDWFAQSSAGEHCIGRPEKGQSGSDAAASYLAGEVSAGRITLQPPGEAADEAPQLYGPVPLLDPRLPATRTNVRRAHEVMDTLAEYQWRPRGGYPGSDNP